MDLSEIQKTILRWLSNNHKTTGEIRQNVCDDLGRSVTDEVFSTALHDLHASRLVTSYIHDNESKVYALVTSPEGYDIDVLYWLLTEEAG